MPTTYAIPNGALFFASTVYTGNGGTQTVSNATNTTTGVTFTPDFIWIKNYTSSSEGQNLNDTVQGLNKQLYSNTTNAQYANTDQITAFTSTGFTTGASGTTNGSSASIVAEMWKAGGTAVSNTSGTITSQVSANTTNGFSVVTYTGNGTSGATIGHGLGVAPQWILVKSRSNAVEWKVWQVSYPSGNHMILNNNAALNTDTTVFTTTTPTTTVFTVGSNVATNGSAYTFVAYCFAPVAGFSQFGSFVGNGSTDGTFVYLGFRPRYIMIKNESATSSPWAYYDSSREPYNQESANLHANDTASASADSTQAIDFLSNGFKLRGTSFYTNGSGNTMMYCAFAENPFKYANAR
jgi:hypothetical protein